MRSSPPLRGRLQRGRADEPPALGGTEGLEREGTARACVPGQDDRYLSPLFRGIIGVRNPVTP